MKNTVYLIAPDSASEGSFVDAFVRRDIRFIIDNSKITPRVIKGEKNPSKEVADDLAGEILQAYHKKFRYVAIACNTLQLWIPQAIKMLDKKINKSIKIVTTFEEVKKAFPVRTTRPIWIGTTVVEKEIPVKDFSTLISLNKIKLQHKVQEIIWRTKAVTGSDITTAWRINNIYSKKVLIQKTAELLIELNKLKFRSFILGCTELPVAFQMLPKTTLNQFTMYDPAEFVADAILKDIYSYEHSDKKRINEIKKTLLNYK